MNKSKILLGIDVFIQVAVLITAIITTFLTQEDSTTRGLKYLIIPGFYFLFIGLWNFFGNALYMYFQKEASSWRRCFLAFAFIFLVFFLLVFLSSNFIPVMGDFFQSGMFLSAPFFALTYLILSAREFRAAHWNWIER